MATEPLFEPDSTGQLRRIELTLTPKASFPVPASDGYSVYSALLGVLDTIDSTVSERVHDSNLGSVHTSGLLGRFGGSDRPHHKTVLADESYTLFLGVVDPADEEIFQALVSALVLEGRPLELSHGQLHIERFESSNTSHETILETADAYDDPTINIRFQSPTCIEDASGVTTMFPHRGAVFTSLMSKWNRTSPEELELALDRETLKAGVIEKPNASSYDTHSVLVNRVENEAGETRNIFRQGFTGECAYAFKDASKAVKNTVTTLALFGSYTGVGSAVARGCGSVEVSI